eukprot:14773071-Ditylum_brightwellii.AAC.1
MWHHRSKCFGDLYHAMFHVKGVVEIMGDVATKPLATVTGSVSEGSGGTLGAGKYTASVVKFLYVSSVGTILKIRTCGKKKGAIIHVERFSEGKFFSMGNLLAAQSTAGYTRLCSGKVMELGNI